ncbi:MAG: pyridoxal phosphate-dependent aminotransferase [Pyrodictiaceae archaeon]
MVLPRLNPRLSLLRESPTRRIDAIRERLSREGRDVILLSTGQPSIPPPRCIRDFLRRELAEESMKLYAYTMSSGITSLREAIAEDIAELGGPKLEADQVIVTAGGQEAMFTVLAAILEEGDEVIVFEPMYFGYWPLISYFGAKPIVIKTSVEDGYQPPIEEFKEAIKPGRTKAVIIVTPDNPTGRILDKKVAKAIAEIASDAGAWIVVDEAYKTLIYEGEHAWLYSYAPENTLAINTFSKDPGIPGWRLGYIYGPIDAVKRIRLLSEEIVYCPPSIAQYMVEAYLRNRECKRKHRRFFLENYRKKRNALLDALREYLPEAIYLPPQGSMFTLVDLSRYMSKREDSVWLAEELLERKNVAVVPGRFFGDSVARSIRISFVTESPERIREGVKRIAELLRKATR